MTNTQIADSLYKLAEAFRGLPVHLVHDGPPPKLQGEAAIGAVTMLWWLRAMARASPNEHLSKDQLLGIIEACSREWELVNPGILELLDQMDGGTGREDG